MRRHLERMLELMRALEGFETFPPHETEGGASPPVASDEESAPLSRADALANAPVTVGPYFLSRSPLRRT